LLEQKASVNRNNLIRKLFFMDNYHPFFSEKRFPTPHLLTFYFQNTNSPLAHLPIRKEIKR